MADRDILYLALTRPALMWGVPVEAMLMNAFGCFTAGAYLQAPTIWRCPFLFWAAAIPIHYALRYLTARDFHWARTFELWLICVWRPILYSLPIGRARSVDDVETAIVTEPPVFRRPSVALA